MTEIVLGGMKKAVGQNICGLVVVSESFLFATDRHNWKNKGLRAAKFSRKYLFEFLETVFSGKVCDQVPHSGESMHREEVTRAQSELAHTY